MIDFDMISLFLSLAGIFLGVLFLVKALAASLKIQVKCESV